MRLVRRHGDWVLAIALAALFQLEVWIPDPSPGGAISDDVGLAERAVAAASGLIFPLPWAGDSDTAHGVRACVRRHGSGADRPLDAKTSFVVALLIAVSRWGRIRRESAALIGVLEWLGSWFSLSCKTRARSRNSETSSSSS